MASSSAVRISAHGYFGQSGTFRLAVRPPAPDQRHQAGGVAHSLSDLHGHPCPAHPIAVGAPCARCGIRWVGVCAALDQDELGDLEAIMNHRRLGRGQSLLMEGDAAGFAYNVIAGGMKLFKSLPDGRMQITGFLLPGDFLGLPLRGAYAYSAEALSDSVLCRFPRNAPAGGVREAPAIAGAAARDRARRSRRGAGAHAAARPQNRGRSGCARSCSAC